MSNGSFMICSVHKVQYFSGAGCSMCAAVGGMSFQPSPAQRLETLPQIQEHYARKLLISLGVDCSAPGMIDTPARMAKSLGELMSGRLQDAGTILATTFDEQCDELILVKDIPFVSVCEHHIMPFTGTVTIGYLSSDGRVIGLSKFARLVECFARRPQVQERLTRQIASALIEHAKASFVGVVVRGSHSCMRLRGVQSDGLMVTSCILPADRRESAERDEFLRFAI